MGGKPTPPPVRVALVAWSGDVGQLACRLNMPEPLLTSRLNRLAQHRNGSRLVVEVALSNCGPILAALARMLEGAPP